MLTVIDAGRILNPLTGRNQIEGAVVMGIGRGGPPSRVPFTPTFQAERPFVFLIRDRQSGAILFLGRVTGW